MALEKLKNFINESIRVFRITKKPSTEEFKITIKVTAIGTLIIGLIGFIIHIIAQLIK
ncbi:MAG: protein translocase SEC61 complex subunit gamma [Nanoarchaeota archaeon]